MGFAYGRKFIMLDARRGMFEASFQFVTQTRLWKPLYIMITPNDWVGYADGPRMRDNEDACVIHLFRPEAIGQTQLESRCFHHEDHTKRLGEVRGWAPHAQR